MRWRSSGRGLFCSNEVSRRMTGSAWFLRVDKEPWTPFGTVDSAAKFFFNYLNAFRLLTVFAYYEWKSETPRRGVPKKSDYWFIYWKFELLIRKIILLFSFHSNLTKADRGAVGMTALRWSEICLLHLGQTTCAALSVHTRRQLQLHRIYW